MQNREKIIQAIAAYLEKNTEHIWHSQGERMAFSEPCEYPVFSEQSFLQARAAEIAAAIAPHLEAGARCYPEIIQAIKTSPQTKEKYESGENYLIQGGKKYTMKELVGEMENNTSVGIGLQESLFKLTIDLLMRGKETLEPKDFPYSELFNHMANEHGLTLTNTELGDIIHIARGKGTKTGWEDAPEWAEWRTVDGNGDITYWKDKPEPSKRNDYWTLAKGDRYEQIPHTVKDWKETLQERPR